MQASRKSEFMKNQIQLNADNPHEVLGVNTEASAEEIRKAYMAMICKFPPDRYPQAFEQVRDAYDLLSDPHQRAKNMMSVQPQKLLVDIIKGDTPGRQFVGPDSWLKAIRVKNT